MTHQCILGYLVPNNGVEGVI